ncbi:MAG: hypothetical protein WCL34_12705 [Methylococcaceae bacterium]
MRIKKSFTILVLSSSVLFGRYLLTPVEQTPIQKEIPIEKIEHSIQKQQIIQPTKIYWKNFSETNFDLNEQITQQKETDLNEMANCPECLQKLKNRLLHGSLKEIAKLANEMAETNNPNLATLLAEMIDKSNQNQRRNVLLEALQKFNSPDVAKAFANYLTGEHEVSDMLRYQLATNINQTTDRQQVQRDLMQLFNETQNPVTRNQLLAIDYPEMVAQVSNQALTDNDLPLFNQAKEQLMSNPYDTAPDALLSLKDSLPPDEMQQALNTWMERQGSGTRLDFINDKFAQGGYSPEEQTMMLEALMHSENPVQGAEIITHNQL